MFVINALNNYLNQTKHKSYRYDGNKSDQTRTDLIIYFPLLDNAVDILATW